MFSKSRPSLVNTHAPVFDIPTNQSTAKHWYDWFVELERQFGQIEASNLWMRNWVKSAHRNVLRENFSLVEKMERKSIIIRSTNKVWRDKSVRNGFVKEVIEAKLGVNIHRVNSNTSQSEYVSVINAQYEQNKIHTVQNIINNLNF